MYILRNSLIAELTSRVGLASVATSQRSFLTTLFHGVLSWTLFRRGRTTNKLPQMLIRARQVFRSQVHHMSTAIAFKSEPFLHLAAGIEMPECIFSIEILSQRRVESYSTFFASYSPKFWPPSIICPDVPHSSS